MKMNKLIELTGRISGIKYKEIELDRPIIDIAGNFSSKEGTTLLLSGGNLDCSKFHILGIKPWLIFSGNGNRMTFKSSDKELSLEGNPFDILEQVLGTYRISETGLPFPIGSGLFGYLSYDLKDCLEKLPRTSINDLNLPLLYMSAPSIILIEEKKSRRKYICVTEMEGRQSISFDDAADILVNEKNNDRTCPDTNETDDDSLRSNFRQDSYVHAIEKIREYIASGHVYQVNMSQRFETGFSGSPFSLFKRLYNENPAPFFAYINAGDHQIVSTSPERFLKLNDRNIETRPIKGTKPRGRDEKEDIEYRSLLENSRKDEAELSMIVDLMRNDIGKVCEASSVKVKEHKRIEAYENVYHLVSIIEGLLKKGSGPVDLLRATFPGGSITGCPKIRSMEIIDELEPNRRHVYTGSIGYISFHGTMDLSIAIRTALIYRNRIYFGVGGGVVYDSDPVDEYKETLHKGKTIMESLAHDNIRPRGPEETVWVNGAVQPVSESAVNISDLGLQYGYGFFETIRYDSGGICFLDDHIDRFNQAWKELFGGTEPDITWDEAVYQVLRANGLEDKISAVKILATFGNRHEPPFNHNIFITARPYTHRLDSKNEKELKLGIYPEPRYSPLASRKTTNYLFYYLAGKWAVKNGFDEALILNPDKSISESNSANILVIRENTIIRPDSSHVLNGVMEKNVCSFLSGNDFLVKREKILPEGLRASDKVIITNSLAGALPVRSINNMQYDSAADICSIINRGLLNQGPS